ncbi:hypothetical protein MM300_22705 [Evansella sp. LMS18]|uniref:hypothetical protein n=1 Tax=Evansella sp. LMS18 TaxID=2924033 RepID=UPI0020D09849|nr:hypothetical protein [Evansella sp. LMS18]UTR10640.1 hypothetical protein MM300_22705 [Evansella sp. LMS18]
MNKAKLLIQISAIYAVIGVFIGGHMAGAGSYLFRAVHTHILVVGWLSLFAFAVFYALFKIPKDSKLAKIHVWTAIIGSIGLTTGMWLYNFQPAWSPELFSLLYFIIGGSILMVSFFVFLVMVFVHGKFITDKE